MAHNREVEWERTLEHATTKEVRGSGCHGRESGNQADASAIAYGHVVIGSLADRSGVRLQPRCVEVGGQTFQGSSHAHRC